jgi:hypothetical protein
VDSLINIRNKNMDDDFDELLFHPSSVGHVHRPTTRSPCDEGAALPYRFRDNEIFGDSDTGTRSNSPFGELCSTELGGKPILPDVNPFLPPVGGPRSVEMPTLDLGQIDI